MPLNPVVCGLAIVAGLEVTDPIGGALMLAMPAPMFAWTSANVVPNPTLNVPLLAVGALAVGQGGFTVGSSSPLTAAIGAAIGMTDPAGLSKMDIITAHYASVIQQYGQFVPAGLVAWTATPPGFGPVTGTCGIVLTQPFKFYEALALTDDDSVRKWTAFGDAIKTHLEAFALVTPTAMANPVGGPLTGTGAVS